MPRLRRVFGNVAGEAEEAPSGVASLPKTSSVGLPAKVYVKALPLRDLSDVAIIKEEIKAGNVVIARITPLARKSVEDVKQAIGELCEYVEILGGDIARLGEERIVVTPPFIKIWRKKQALSEGGESGSLQPSK